ncbi:MAG: CPBP family intramembrane metalloprotease [Actinomycetota bacterium]|nr:CPBP family intramembrane metalloprotease [Actinomycetota bacterium]
MPSDPAEILSGVLLADSLILGLVIGFFWAGVFVARRLGYPVSYGLEALGLTRPGSGYLAAVRLGFLVGAGALISTIPLNLLSFFVLERLGFSTESTVQAPLMEGIQGWIGENPQTAIPATVFVIVLFAPAVEEVIFRGAIFGGLRRLSAFLLRRLREGDKGKTGETLSFVLAALASSVAFALLHFEPVLLPALLVLAVALCALFRRTGSLLPCLVAHATFNSFAVLILILMGLGVLPTQI